MKKTQKILAICLSTTMLLGMTVTANAASCIWKEINLTYWCSSCKHECGVYKCSVDGHSHYKCAHNHVR